jgi:polyisoprenoid-binding protein YceI
MIKISGKSEKVDGTIDFSKSQDLGSVQIDLNSFDTGMDSRNEHMKEKYLEVGKADFKMAVFKLEKINGNDFSGKMKLHGVEKNIAGKTTTKFDDKSCVIEASFSLKLSEFAIEIPTYLGVTVAEDVEINVALKGNIP